MSRQAPVVGSISSFGFMRKNWAPLSGDRTLVITGVEPADGATIVANCVRRLGVSVFFFPAGASLTGQFNMFSGEHFRSTGRQLTAQHKTWAARVPFRPAMLKSAARTVPNPHFVFVCEDAASIALGIESNAAGGADYALAEAARRNADLAFFASECRWPTMLMSLQKAREFATDHVDALCQFGELKPTPERRLAAIALIDQGAKSLHAPAESGQRSAQGALDAVQKNATLKGWAKIPLSDERVLLRILINGAEVSEALADQYREDLVRHNIGDGNHGFAVALTQFLTDQPQRIEVLSAIDNSFIGAAEMSRAGGRAVG